MSKSLWAITCYFNPSGYRRRLDNYRTFREQLVVPLVTVELSQDGNYVLDPGDSDVLVQVSCPDLLWQKERLLNIALASLPPDCTIVAWLDCDVIFENDDWPERTIALLDSHVIVMPYARVYELAMNESLDGRTGTTEHKRPNSYSLPFALAQNLAPPGVLRENMRLKGVACGLAGAARRATLEQHGFYDACVMGSGNRAIACAAIGRFDDATKFLQMNTQWAEHYLKWARSFFDTVQGKVGYLDEDVYHLWHGDLKNRRYVERHKILNKFDYDPARDIFIDENGCLRWRQASAEIKIAISDYFQSRREDG